MSKLGYRMEMSILKAEEFGVPQERRRVFFVATRTDAPILFPAATHGPELRPFVPVWDAISDLPALRNGEKPDRLHYARAAQNGYQRMLRGNRVLVYNHAAPRLAKVNEERMRHIPPGGSWRDIPFKLLPTGMKRARRCDHTKRYFLYRARLTGVHSTKRALGRVHSSCAGSAFTVREVARPPASPTSYSREAGQSNMSRSATPCRRCSGRAAEAMLMAMASAERAGAASGPITGEFI